MICSALATHLLIETVAIAGIGCAVLVPWHQLRNVLQHAAGVGNGAIAFGVLPRLGLVEIMIVIDAAAAKVAHQLVPHQRSGIHILAQRVARDCCLQKLFALAAHTLLVEDGQAAGHQLGDQQQYEKGAVLLTEKKNRKTVLVNA